VAKTLLLPLLNLKVKLRLRAKPGLLPRINALAGLKKRARAVGEKGGTETVLLVGIENLPKIGLKGRKSRIRTWFQKTFASSLILLMAVSCQMRNASLFIRNALRA